MRLLLVEDEKRLSEALAHLLKKNGYCVDTALDGDTAIEMAATGVYDLIVLDRMLPGRSGLAVLREFRSLGFDTPVLFLTAKDAPNDRVEGLDAGADDYIVGILLDNALRYTPIGGSISILLHKSPQAVHVEVSDTGPGIAAEYQEKIFDRFYQVDPSRSKELGGAGLGLAIAKCLAACQKGYIKVKSRPGKGSTFSVLLSLENAHD